MTCSMISIPITDELYIPFDQNARSRILSLVFMVYMGGIDDRRSVIDVTHEYC
jgi:hypothetical protein